MIDSQPWHTSLGLKSDPFLVEGVFYPGAQRRVCLDELVHQVRFNDAFVVVSGTAGIGKTVLCEQFMSALDAESVTVGCVDASVLMGPEQLLDFVAQAYEITGGLSGALVDRITQLRHFCTRKNNQHKRCVLVIDDAHSLSKEALLVLAELASPVQDAQSSFHLVLFAHENIMSVLSHPALSRRLDHLRYELTLLPLNEQEVGEYIQYRLKVAGYHGSAPLAANRINYIHKQTGGVVAAVDSVAVEMLKMYGDESQKKIGLPMMHMAAVIVLGLTLLIAVLFNRGGSDSLVATNAPVVVEAKAEAVLGSELQKITPIDGAGVLVAGGSIKAHAVHQSTISETGESLGDTAPVKPVFAPSVDEREGLELNTVLAHELDVSSGEGGADDGGRAALLPPAAGRGDLLVLPVEQYYREDWLLSQDGEHYTLQVLGSHSEDAVREFIDEAGETMAYYAAEHKGQPWYVVLYGDYITRAAAIAAAKRLPVLLRQRKPWPRKFQSIQDVIQ